MTVLGGGLLIVLVSAPAHGVAWTRTSCLLTHVFITVNGEPHELTQPLTVAELLATLA